MAVSDLNIVKDVALNLLDLLPEFGQNPSTYVDLYPEHTHTHTHTHTHRQTHTQTSCFISLDGLVQSV